MNQTQDFPFRNSTQTIQQEPQPLPFDAAEKLQGVIERHAGKVFNNIMEMAGIKFGIASEGESFLDKGDSEDLAILIPFLIADLTKQQMTPVMQKQAAYGVYGISLVTKAIKNRFNNKKFEQPK